MSNGQAKPITVLIADDHEMTRQGIRNALNHAPDMKVVGEAQDGDEIKQLVASLRPRILLLDLVMPKLSPTELEKWARENYPETITLILSAHDRDAYLSNMMDAGAAGYLCKNKKAEQLIVAIRRAASGESLFDEEQFLRAKRWREEVGNKLNQLTRRELEILKLLAKGYDNAAISQELTITIRTTTYHITNLLKKLGLKNRQEAAIWALKHLSDNLEESTG